MSRKSSSAPVAGESLGSGSYKSCYVLPKKRVALAHHNCEESSEKSIQEEFRMLCRLKRLGIPVPDTHVGKVVVDGEEVDALIMPNYPFHNRDVNLFEHVNKRMLTCLEDIYFTCKRKRLEIYDFQFLFDRRGNVVVTDPPGHLYQQVFR